MSCFIDPTSCPAGEVASTTPTDALGRFVATVLDAIQSSTSMFMTFWMNPAFSPAVADGNAATANVSVLQGALQTVTIVAAVVGILLGCLQVAFTHRAGPVLDIGKMFLTVITVTGLAALTVQIGLTWGDSFSPWIIEQATGKPAGQAVDLFPQAAAKQLGAFMVILLGGLIVLSSLAQVAIMLARTGLLPVLIAVLPVVAAMSSSEAGKVWFKKVLAWMMVLVLYKPVAALVYAGGLASTSSPTMQKFLSDPALTATVKPLFQMLSGLTVLLVAVLCLPAMLKLVSPLATSVRSGLFSGAGVAVAGVTGAVPVAALGAQAGIGARAGAVATGLGGSAARGGSAIGGASAVGSAPAGGRGGVFTAPTRTGSGLTGPGRWQDRDRPADPVRGIGAEDVPTARPGVSGVRDDHSGGRGPAPGTAETRNGRTGTTTTLVDEGSDDLTTSSR